MHVSGHASQEELKFLLDLVQPEWFVPGARRVPAPRAPRAARARTVGVPTDHVLVCEDGDVLTLELADDGTAGSRSSGARCPPGYQYVDGIVGDVGHGVLRDRRNLAEEGLVVVIVTVDSTTGELVTGPEIVTRGWVYAPEAEELLEEAKAAVRASLAGGGRRGRHRLRDAPPPRRRSLGKFINERTRRRPAVIPVVIEV